MSVITEIPNERAGGKGGFVPPFHIVRAWPALPHHERWATTHT
jgi:hypothetical protein